MKKLFAALTVVAYLFIASSAMAAGYKAPKEICLQASPGAIFCLASKSFGSVVLEEKIKLQYYLIAGSFYQNGMHHPLSGSGYMDSSVFRFHISGQFFSGEQIHQSVDGYVNLAVEPATGSITAIFTRDKDDVVQQISPLLEVPCSGVAGVYEIPLSEPVSEAPAESMYEK